MGMAFGIGFGLGGLTSLGGGGGAGGPGLLPLATFAANFLDRPGWVDGFSYTRATAGALVDTFTGAKVQPLASEIPLRGGRRVQNLLAYSESFDNAEWVKGSATATISGEALPSGATEAWKIVEGAGLITPNISDQSLPVVAGESYFLIVSALADERNWARIGAGNSPFGAGDYVTARSAYFNLATASVGTKGSTFTHSGVVDEGDGWVTCWVRGTAATTTTLNFDIVPASGDLGGTYTGDGASGIHVTKAMMVKARPGQTIPDPEYISNGVLSSPYHGFGVDGVRWFSTDEDGLDLTDAGSGYPVRCTGMARRPAVTNLAWPSESFAGQAITVTNAAAYTLNFYGTGSIGYSGAATGTLVGTGADERVSVTFTTTTTTLTLAAPSGTVTKVQVETGSVANDHVPTTSAAATANAETIALVPATIGYDQNGGVWVVEYNSDFDSSEHSNTQAILGVYNTGNLRAALYNRSGGLGVYLINTTEQSNFGGGSYTANETNVSVLRLEENDVSLYSNNALIGSDAIATIPSGILKIELGDTYTIVSKFAGGFFRLYYLAPGTLTDEQLLYLSAGNLPYIPVLTS